MRHPLIKGFFVMLVMFTALGICFFGYRVNANRTQEQKLAYAESMAEKNGETLDKLADEAAAFYTDDTKEFLAANIKEDTVTELQSEVEAVQASADDFEIEGTNINTDLKALDTKKTKLITDLNDVSQRLKLQNKIGRSFTNDSITFQPTVEDVTIREDLTTDDLAEIQNQVNETTYEAWRNAANHYLNLANEQLKKVADIQGTFDSYMRDGALIASVDYTQYYAVEAEIALVKNETLRNDFQQQLNQLNDLMQGISGSESSSDSESMSEEESSSEDSYGEDSDSGY